MAANTIIVSRFIVEIIKYGTILEIIIYAGFIGETSKSSIVPNSFSLTIEIDVIIAHINVSTRAITPGTKLYEPLSSGL